MKLTYFKCNNCQKKLMTMNKLGFVKCPICGRNEEEKKAINQTNVRTIIELIGKEAFVDMMQHIGVHDEIFDLEEDCGAPSCRYCGACGCNDYNLKITDVRDKQGNIIYKYEHILTDYDDELVKLFRMEIKCRICGEIYKTWTREEEDD